MRKGSLLITIGLSEKDLKSIGKNVEMDDVVKANKEPSQLGTSQAGDYT